MSPAIEDTQKVPTGPECRVENEARPATYFLADNMPTIITYILGATLLSFTGVPAPTLYAIYCVLSTILIWRFVCVHCQYFGGVCQCGFSVAATRLFEKGDESLIRSRKMLLAALVLPCWLVPPLVGIFLLITGFSWVLLWVLLGFIVIAFTITPYISWKIGCCDVWRYLSWSKSPH